MINLIYIPTRPKLKQEQILTDPGYNFGIYSGCALILKNVFHSWFTLSPLGFFIGGGGCTRGLPLVSTYALKCEAGPSFILPFYRGL